MENKQITIESYIITYSNLIEFEGRKLAFRKKELFDVSGIPSLIKRSDQGWWIGRKLLTPTKAKELTKIINHNVDVTGLQWYDQEKLNHVFNL